MRIHRQKPILRVPGEGVVFVAVVFAAATTVGCGKAGTWVRGAVTLDGKAVENAVVQFFPKRQDGGRTAATVTDASGRFVVAVAPDTYRVTILGQRTVGQKPDDSNPKVMVDVREMVTPERYRHAKTSPLTVEAVEGQTTVVDFPLNVGK